MDAVRHWLGRHGYLVVIASVLVFLAWAWVDPDTAKWGSTGLLVVGLLALAGRGLWGERSSRT